MRRFIFLLFLMIPITASAVLLDDMSDNYRRLRDMTRSTANESASSISLKTVDNGISGQAQEVTYSLSSSGWVIFYSEYKIISSKSGRGLRLFYRGNTPGNTLEVKLRNADDTSQTSAVLYGNASQTNGWQESFTLLSDIGASVSATNFDRIELALSVGVAGSAGYIDIDEIEIYDTNTDGKLLWVDNFDDLTDPNMLGGNNNTTWDDPGGSGNVSVGYITSPTLNASLGALACTAAPASGNLSAVVMLGLNDTDVSSYDSVVFSIRSQTGGGSIAIGVKDKNGVEHVVDIDDYLPGGLTNSYQEVQIPLSVFSGVGVTLSKVNSFQLWFNENKSGEGLPDNYSLSDTLVVYLEDLRFLYDTITAHTVYKFDDMSIPRRISPWGSAYDSNGSTVAISVINDGYVGDAYRLTYDLAGGNWIVIYRDISLSISKDNAIEFYVKGTGSSNDLEIKLTDNDKTLHRAIVGAVTNTNWGWKKRTVPLTDFTYVSGGTDKNLDLNKIEKIEIAIGNALNGGAGGAGTAVFDELQSLTSDFNNIGDENSLLSNLEVLPNPFSPNGDGIDEEAEFRFSLSKPAEVKLAILDMSGKVFYETKSAGILQNGSHSMYWDGNDRYGKIARNGIFMFQIEASTSSGERAVQRHVVFVMK